METLTGEEQKLKIQACGGTAKVTCRFWGTLNPKTPETLNPFKPLQGPGFEVSSLNRRGRYR